MHQLHTPLWLVIAFFSQHLTNAVTDSVDVGTNTTISKAFPQLNSLDRYPASLHRLFWGGQDMNHCCLLAVRQSLNVSSDGILLGLNQTRNFLKDDLNIFMEGQFPCGAEYIGNDSGAPVVQIPYSWCRENCPGWQLSKASKLHEWVSSFVGFLVPALVFCLAIPRRRKLHVPEVLFDVALNEVTSNLYTPLIALSAAILVTIDTVVWLMTIFALSGPILLSGVYEASLDQRVLGYVHEKIRNKRLSTEQRARLLYTILVGNLDMLTVPEGEPEGNTALSHIDGLVKDLRPLVNADHEGRWRDRDRAVATAKTRLRTMLAAQYSFGVTVGAPVMFFCGSFLYTLIDNYSKLGNNNISHALAFGMWWQVLPHVAIISGLLLAGNNPNTLEGIVGKSSCKRQEPHLGLFELVYESRYTPAWIWQRGRSKNIWVQRLCHDPYITPDGLEDRVNMNAGRWIVVIILTYSLILIPSVLAFLTSYYTPLVGLSCRSMTFLVYMLCQIYLTALWIWDIDSTYLDEWGGAPHTPVSRIPWILTKHPQERTRAGYIQNWQAWIWWPFVLVGGACAVFTAIGGTMMQIMGVYRNCLCSLTIGHWRQSRFDTTFQISTNSPEDIDIAKTWWKGTGATAVAFLGLISYVGWWYQRRLRYRFKLLVDQIDNEAEDNVVPFAAPTAYVDIPLGAVRRWGGMVQKV